MDADTVPIKVLCRIRPLSNNEVLDRCQFLPVLYDDKTSLSLSGKQFNFDKVYGPETSQEQIYSDGVSAIVNDVLNGYNGTIFAYGQTASGKTHTIEGCLTNAELTDTAGVTPRILTDMFDHIQKQPVHTKTLLKISYFEVHMDKIKDLLDVSKVNLPVHEDKNKVPYVKGVTEIEAKTMTEVYKILDKGRANRSVAVTNMNEHSSRSHSVFLLHVKQTDTKADKTIHGKLFLVDLAGSEKVNKTGAEGTTLKEAKKINKSLSALGNVISALADGNKNHIPYRDSKLTRILQESLGGNSRTSIIICCSPASSNEPETRSTLMFGQRAKTIKNEIHVNEVLTAEEWKRRFEKEKEKNSKLRSKLAQYELGAIPAPKENSPDVIPQTSTSLTSVPTMTSHASMPCLFTAISSLDGCAECRKWERDYESLCNQLDDKDDELTERSKEILELESQLRDSRQEVTSLTENNKTITEEFADVQARLDSSQSEVKDAFVVVDTLAVSYDEKESELVTKMQENEDLMLKMAQLEAEVLRTREELSQTKTDFRYYQKHVEEETGSVKHAFLQMKSAVTLYQQIDALKKANTRSSGHHISTPRKQESPD